MARPDLPDYESPPIDEVVVGIQFGRLQLTGSHIGLFWSCVRDKLPIASEHPPLEPRLENFSTPTVAQFPLIFGLPRLRYWLATEDGTELLQLQNDRLIFNWRRRTPEQAYPHFEWIQQKFMEWLSAWRAFLAEHNLELKISQFEVTYVNRISIADRPLLVDEVMSFLAPPLREGLGGKAEATSLSSQRVLAHEGIDWARAYISAQNAQDERGNPSVSFELTVRGPLSADLQILQLRAREWIVRAFDNLTSPEMHKVWGKR